MIQMFCAVLWCHTPEVLMLQLFCLYTYAHRNMYRQISNIHIKIFFPFTVFHNIFPTYGLLTEMIRSNDSYL